MIRDPLYNDIIEGLGRSLDHQVFEHCVANLLRVPFPGTVPIPGGSDSGMDGAVPDGEGLAYPLVITTGKSVIGNLKKNLSKYVSDGRTRRKVLAATSQKLTPQ